MPQGVFLEPFVNTAKLLPHCDMVCCHGGNGTLYQALHHGLPCVVVATHAEQHFGGKRVRELGLGVSLTLKEVRRSGVIKLLDALKQVLGTPGYRERARAFSQCLGGWNSAARAADAIEDSVRSVPGA